MEFLFKPGMLLATAILGMLTHFLKKSIKGETPTAIWQFFKDNFRSTLIALIATCVGFAGYMTTLATGLPVDFLTVFSIGYLCDSMFNRWDGA
jgi:hypothetical protein